MLAAVLTGLVDADRGRAVRKFVVVVPQGSNAEGYEAQAWSEMVATFRLLARREMDPREQDWFSARFEIVVAPDWRSRSVLDVIAAQPERTAVIVTDAANDPDNSVDPYIAPGALTPLRPQDFWAPQLHALARAAVELARERMLYVALDANEFSPSREALSDLLLSIDGCGIMGSSSEEDSTASWRGAPTNGMSGSGMGVSAGLFAISSNCRPSSPETSPISASRCSTEPGTSRLLYKQSARK